MKKKTSVILWRKTSNLDHAKGSGGSSAASLILFTSALTSHSAQYLCNLPIFPLGQRRRWNARLISLICEIPYPLLDLWARGRLEKPAAPRRFANGACHAEGETSKIFHCHADTVRKPTDVNRCMACVLLWSVSRKAVLAPRSLSRCIPVSRSVRPSPCF